MTPRRNPGFLARLPRPSGFRLDRSGRALVAFLGVLGLACSAAPEDSLSEEPELVTPAGENLSGCHGKAASSIPASGVYVLTTFGGPSEPQPLACGGHSKSGSWYYAASKQRYGCGTRVRIEANGKCVVAQTDDYGPDVCVEKAVGMPVMDVSPLVSKHLFGTKSLGWSDRKKVTVEVADDDTPLGPCAVDNGGGGGSGGSGGSSGGGGTGGSGGSGGSAGGAGSGSSGGSGGSSGGGSGGSGSGGGGQKCTSDGACNPGNDGSGKICVGGVCVPGCKTNAQCPGVTTCKSGQCQ
ncbi:MAG: hypothetical protein IT375_01260 [Polyangiaceae bacterium]|nr:hypothetical protein [Polyangiaceae bacterium]